MENWTYVESPSPMIFHADKPSQKLIVPKIRHRFFPVYLKANTFHRVNMTQRVNSCTIEETVLQTSYEFNNSQGSKMLLRSGRSYYSEDDSD